MAKNTSKKNTKATKRAINLDFTEAYKKFQEELDTPHEGTMKAPKKLTVWQRIKRFFKKK